MTRDFTYKIYESLLQAGVNKEYEHITVRDYLTHDKLPEQFIIHRHDVDRKPMNSLAIAQIEAKHNISSTYYFRTIDKTLKPDIIEEIEDLGHEIGYHYEDMDRQDGDTDNAHDSFESYLNKLRNHATIDTVCMHGNPLTPHDNRNMWDDSSDFEQYALEGEAYLSMDFVDVTYFSDTGRTWQDGSLKIKDYTIGESTKSEAAETTKELIKLIKQEELSRLCLLTHPNRWAGTYPEYLIESTKDVVTNVGKRVLKITK